MDGVGSNKRAAGEHEEHDLLIKKSKMTDKELDEMKRTHPNQVSLSGGNDCVSHSLCCALAVK